MHAQQGVGLEARAGLLKRSGQQPHRSVEALLMASGDRRLIGVNAIGSKTVVLLLLIGILYGRIDMFVDIALAYAFLNFVAVLAASRYFHKRKGLYEESFMD